MIQIRSRYDATKVIYEAEVAATVKLAIEKAVLRGADLSDADLRGANLRGADLGDADLGGADLSGADLSDADLRGAYLSGADLGDIRADLWEVLDRAPHEVPGLLAALHEGRVDGSTYSGECACLIGTIANEAGCGGDSTSLAANLAACGIDLRPDAERPIERWFLAIRHHTPENNALAAHAVDWIVEWADDRWGEDVAEALR